MSERGILQSIVSFETRIGRSDSRKASRLTLRRLASVTVLALGSALSMSAIGNTIVDEWATVKPPAPPELKPAKVDPKETALLVLDFVKQTCPARPRCVASLPKTQKLLAQAREKGMLVVFATVSGTVTDVLPELAPREGEPSVTSGPNKFLNTDLEKILRDKGIKTVIVTGTAAEGAVLNTAATAALLGFKVIVPVDGVSSTTSYGEQYTAWHLANSPRVGPQVTLTKFELIAL